MNIGCLQRQLNLKVFQHYVSITEQKQMFTFAKKEGEVSWKRYFNFMKNKYQVTVIFYIKILKFVDIVIRELLRINKHA